jgi:acid phosphatase (class A)
MTTTRWIIAGLIALVAYLTLHTPDRFPFPPQFVEPRDIAMDTLKPPPAPDSAEFKRSLEGIIALQKKLSAKEKEAILHEDHMSPEMIVLPVLGEEYTAEKYPALYTLLRHAASDAWRICDMTQEYWKSPRPWNADPRVEALANKLARPGYPSGHTTTNTVWAHVLSDLFPNKRSALLTRAYGVAGNRIKAGAHFPHDVEGGKILAKAVYEKMRTSKAYQRELEAAKEELKAVKN